MDLLIFLSCKRKTNILKNLTKENLHLNPPPPPPPHTHTHTHTYFHHETWSFLGPSPRSFFGIILSKQKPHVNVGNSQKFYSFNYQDCSLYFRSCFNYHLVYSLTVILLHFPCFLRPDAQSPCQNACEGVGNIKKIDITFSHNGWHLRMIIKLEYIASGH